MVYTLKVYLVDPTNCDTGHSIRRLTVNSDVVASFPLLLNKLQSLLQLPIADMVVKWKDAEHDYILMSTDDELAQAVANSVDSLLRIWVSSKPAATPGQQGQPKWTSYKSPLLWSSFPPLPMGPAPLPTVFPPPPPTMCPTCCPRSMGTPLPCSDCSPSTSTPAPSPAPGTEDLVSHGSVLCDGCDANIRGIRYKCLSCKDYDLCSSCNAQGKHPHHDMIKLVKPVDQQREWVFMGSRRLWSSMFHRRKACAPKVCGGKLPGDFLGNFPESFHKLLNGDTVPLTETVVNSIDTLAKCFLGADVRIENPHVVTENVCKKQKTTENVAAPEPATPMETTDSAPQVEKPEEPRGLFQPQSHQAMDILNTAVKSLNLKSAGESIRCAPLIDLQEQATAPEAETSYVDGWCLVQGEDPHFIETSSASTSGTSSPADANSSSATEVVGNTVQAVGTTTAAEVVGANTAPEAVGTTTTTTTVATETVEATAAAVGTTTSAAAIGTTSEPVYNFASASAYALPGGATSVTSGSFYPVTVTCGIGNPGFENGTAAQGNSAEQNNNQSNASSHFIETKDPVIVNAVYAMMNMGFTNEGGWLEKLLTSKGGNVNDVLDSLYPQPRGRY